MIPKEFQPLKKAFLKYRWQGWEDSQALFDSITHMKKAYMHLYNYKDYGKVERNHPVVMRCRGIVVDDDGKLLNYPFDRFFNYYEKEAAAIDWDSAVAQEKIDGSLICVFWNGFGWEITTRGSFYPSDDKTARFDEWFNEIFGRDNYNRLNKDNCYMFELVSKHNRIVKRYDDEFVALIGVRRLKNQQEHKPYPSSLLNVRYPLSYDVSDFDNCMWLLENCANDDEGFVVVDKYFNRMKIKRKEYIKLMRIKMLKDKDIFDAIFGKETIDSGLLNDKEVVEKIRIIKENWSRIQANVLNEYNKHKHLLDKSRKEFAIAIKDNPYKPLLFALADNRELSSVINYKLYVKLTLGGENEK